MTIGTCYLAHQRHWLKPLFASRITTAKIIGQVRAPAKAHTDPAMEMQVGFDDRINVEIV